MNKPVPKNTPHKSCENGNSALSSPLQRRRFLAGSSSVIAGAYAIDGASAASESVVPAQVSYDFDRADSLCIGNGWETLNPGCWQIKDQALRRRLVNVGNRARRTGFPFHSATAGRSMETDYDPSLPSGVIYRRDWKLEESFSISAEFVYRGDRSAPGEGDSPDWKMYSDGYGQMGLAFGAKSLFESYSKIRHAIQIAWTDAGTFQITFANNKLRQQTGSTTQAPAPRLRRGQTVSISINVEPASGGKCNVVGQLTVGEEKVQVQAEIPALAAKGYVGIVGRGLIDFEVRQFSVTPQDNGILEAGEAECQVCYALGDSLREVDGNWRVRFMSLFETDGKVAAIKVSTKENPKNGWGQVPDAGQAPIINHSWRRNTAVIDVALPVNPAETTLYYTIWKDGENVTSDPRLESDATGPGTGLVGDVPKSGLYVGRLPQLKAPYKLCGLSCHALTSGLQQRTGDQLKLLGGGDDWQFRDQPTVESYKHLDDYDFQIMLWEDDVWYMELMFYPPSTDDAYKVVKNSIGGPTSRWQMMRHWNVINPGDHDYGMDDVKGPEQLAIRRVDGLGQDAAYMRRNFQIVHHLVTGEESVDPLANPKKWRAWKMPSRDFTLLVLDSRLWRSSQDTDMWDDAGWGEFKNLYDRTDPTRSLLGEEQFAWLQDQIQTDTSPLICLTGINGMHTVWTGGKNNNANSPIQGPFDQRDRVTADYAGWVKAGADRVLELLGSRDGVVTVYGDVHNGCIMRNAHQRVIECSFGPIGRSGGRAVIPGFGRQMTDFDGRELEVFALYHKTHASPDLDEQPAGAPFYWNFLEMQFDPRPTDPAIELRVRNLIDAPQTAPRGGGELKTSASATGRANGSYLPTIRTLANADVQILSLSGQPLRGLRTQASGRIEKRGLVDVQPGVSVLVVAHADGKVDSQIVETIDV